MPEELVEALWIGGYDAELPDRRTLRSGKDTCLIGRTEAETSDNWQIVEPPAPKSAAKTSAKAGD